MAEKPQKLSELPEIVAEEISDNDLLLVSDNDASGGCVSKKMTMAQAAAYICAAVAQDPSVAETIRQAVAEAISEDLEQIVMQTVEKNIDDIADIVADGIKDETMTIDGNNG